MITQYGKPPEFLGRLYPEWDELMHYLYLPVKFPEHRDFHIPDRLEFAKPFLHAVVDEIHSYEYLDDKYVYVTAHRGWASPGHPLNREGWHCDGFGTTDLNYVWSSRYGTRYAAQDFIGIYPDHAESMRQFKKQVQPEHVHQMIDYGFYRLDPYVVHNVPEIPEPGGWRSFLKVSVSPERYNLAGNSHNYLFDYEWEMHSREAGRNDPIRVKDYAEEHAA